MAQSLDKFNSIRLKQKQKDAREALEMDLKVLNEYLLQDEAEKQAKSAKRESLKREMQVYRDYLLEQKQIEKAREEEISRLYTIEDEKVLPFDFCKMQIVRKPLLITILKRTTVLGKTG